MGRDDAPGADKQVGHRDRLIEQAAGVAAKVEHETGQRRTDLVFSELELLA